MNSYEIYTLLQKFDMNKGRILTLNTEEKQNVNYLVINQYVETRNTIGDPASVLKLREKFENIKSKILELKSIKNFHKDTSLNNQFRTLINEEIEIRSEIINKSEINSLAQSAVTIDGKFFSLTYLGRELFNNLEKRSSVLQHLAIDEFIKQLNEITVYFNQTSKKAFDLFNFFKYEFFEVDEIFLNSLVFSLSLIKNDNTKALVKTYLDINMQVEFKLRNIEFAPYISEIIMLNTSIYDQRAYDETLNKFTSIFSELSKFGTQFEETATISAIFLPLISNDFDILRDILSEARNASGIFQSINSRFPITYIPFVILSAFHGNLDKNTLHSYNEVYLKMHGSTEYNYNSSIAAALYFISEQNSNDLFDRYSTIKNNLTRFGEDGLMLPALMLAQIPISVQEILDIIRTACNEIIKFFKGISGLENMNLAIKMILQSSYNPDFLNKSLNMLDNKPISQTTPLGKPMMPFLSSPITARIRPVTLSTAFYSGVMVRSTRGYYNRHHFHPIHRHYMHG
jgi:hypothetical protein